MQVCCKKQVEHAIVWTTKILTQGQIFACPHLFLLIAHLILIIFYKKFIDSAKSAIKQQ